MAIEKTVSEIAEILGVSRQAVNNRVKNLPEEDVDKNEKGVTVVNRSGLIKLEEIYKKTIFEDDPIDEETKQRELLEILVDEKNAVKVKKPSNDANVFNLNLMKLRLSLKKFKQKQKKLFKSKKNKHPLRKDYLLVSLVKNRLIRRSWDESSSLFYKEMMMFLGRNYGKAI